MVGQRREHTVVQQLVLLPTPPRSIRWPLLHLATCDHLAGMELVDREVNFGTTGQPIPIVVADHRATNEDFAEDQFASEQVLNYEGRYPALTRAGLSGRQFSRSCGSQVSGPQALRKAAAVAPRSTP
jgi:hypothetical protein